MKVIDGGFGKVNTADEKDAVEVLEVITKYIKDEGSIPDEVVVMTFNNETGEYNLHTNSDRPNTLWLLGQAAKHCLSSE